MTGAGILGIIENELCIKKKPCPIILFKVNEGLKIGFHYAILLFCLAVCLYMEGGEEFLLDI